MRTYLSFLFSLFLLNTTCQGQQTAFSNLENALAKPSKATTLNLSSQSLNHIDAKALELKNLEALIVDHNQLDNLPMFLKGKWTKLEKITASNNNFDRYDLVNFWFLPKLTYLDLSHNQLKELSNHDYSLEASSIRPLPLRLKTLKLHDNSLEMVGDYIGDFTALEVLDLSKNNLISIHDKIWYLEHLESMNLSNNKLKFIIGASTVVEKSSLKRLDISHNKQYWTIAWLISKIPSLEYLDARHCRFHFGLPSVKKIYKDSPVKILLLGNCGIEKLFPAMGSMPLLAELDLSNNNIKEIPKSFKKMKTLLKMDLSGNPLSKEEKEKIKKLLPHCKINF